MEKIGVDPVQLWLVMVLNLIIGLLTPPVEMVLYTLARVDNISFERTNRAGSQSFGEGILFRQKHQAESRPVSDGGQGNQEDEDVGKRGPVEFQHRALEA